MIEFFSNDSSDLIQQRQKGKRLHRRTQSTFNLDFINPNSTEKKNEFIEEMAERYNILDATKIQKLLQAPSNIEPTKDIIVDDIDEIPFSGFIVPTTESKNPLAFIKSRNLSVASKNVGNGCPVKKINLFLDNKIDELTGLDTIYEKRNSVESIELDDDEQIMNDISGLSCGSKTPNGLKDLNKILEVVDQPLKGSQKNSQVKLERKPHHSRQQSADFVLQNTRRFTLDNFERKEVEKEKSLKRGKSGHSKHSSIDFANKENCKPSSQNASIKAIKVTNNANSMLKCSPLQFDQNNSLKKPSPYNPTSNFSKKSDQIVEIKRNKRNNDYERTFFTLPTKTLDEKAKLPSNKDLKNIRTQIVGDLTFSNSDKSQNAKFLPTKKSPLMFPESSKHSRNATVLVGNSSHSANLKSQNPNQPQFFEKNKNLTPSIFESKFF